MTPYILLSVWVALLTADYIAFRIGSRIHDQLGLGWDHWAANRWRKWPGGGFYVLVKYRRLARR